jgi:hypothetical protein
MGFYFLILVLLVSICITLRIAIFNIKSTTRYFLDITLDNLIAAKLAKYIQYEEKWDSFSYKKTCKKIMEDLTHIDSNKIYYTLNTDSDLFLIIKTDKGLHVFVLSCFNLFFVNLYTENTECYNKEELFHILKKSFTT